MHAPSGQDNVNQTTRKSYTVPCIEAAPSSNYALTLMMEAKRTQRPLEDTWPSIEEIRIVSDLRIMHAKVAELSQLIIALKERHHESDIVKYSDQPVLTKDIQMVDAIYLWFVKVKEEAIAQR